MMVCSVLVAVWHYECHLVARLAHMANLQFIMIIIIMF
jgi:hypothetical protein